MPEQDKLIGLAEGKSFGLQLMRKMKQYVDSMTVNGDSYFFATNAQIRAIINGEYQFDFDEQEPDNLDDEIEEATDDDIESILSLIYVN